jgi:hypothetical protein
MALTSVWLFSTSSAGAPQLPAPRASHLSRGTGADERVTVDLFSLTRQKACSQILLRHERRSDKVVSGGAN